LHCGLSSYSADLNSARNLAHPKLVERQALVTKPNIQMDDFKGVLPNIIANDIMDKSPRL